MAKQRKDDREERFLLWPLFLIGGMFLFAMLVAALGGGVLARATRDGDGDGLTATATVGSDGDGGAPTAVTPQRTGIPTEPSETPEPSTLTPTPTEPPSCTEPVRPTVCVTRGSARVGGVATVRVRALNMPEPGLGAWTINIVFDERLVSVASCQPEHGGICNEEFDARIVRVVGGHAQGLQGESTLATVTFSCEAAGVATVEPLVIIFADSTRAAPQAIAAARIAGGVDCQPGPGPLPTRTATPTFTPTRTLTPTWTPTSTATQVPFGDVNCDGAVDPTDASLVGRFIVAGVPVACPGNADVNLDGRIDMVDSALIEERVAGFISLPPPPQPLQPIVAGTLSIDEVVAAVGGEGEAGLEAYEFNSPGLGVWTIDIVYDPSFAYVTECAPMISTFCNPAYAPNVVRTAGIAPNGITDFAVIATVTFGCLEEGSSPLSLVVRTLADTRIGHHQDAFAEVFSAELQCLGD